MIKYKSPVNSGLLYFGVVQNYSIFVAYFVIFKY
jgi:hypothetical protein